MIAKSISRNPRRLKQFINLFRLQAYIANETGLFDPDRNEAPRLTLEQLGKFVAISLWWPALLADFAQEPKILKRLEGWANGDPSPTSVGEGKWLEDQKRKRLFKFGAELDGQGPRNV
jgi:hypothetical protein